MFEITGLDDFGEDSSDIEEPDMAGMRHSLNESRAYSIVGDNAINQ